jgi:hypothetical protein
MTDESRTEFDPFLSKRVEISNGLVDRLRGKYANGPTMPNGQPEFGWTYLETSAIKTEAADRIETLEAKVKSLQHRLKTIYAIMGIEGIDGNEHQD